MCAFVCLLEFFGVSQLFHFLLPLPPNCMHFKIAVLEVLLIPIPHSDRLDGTVRNNSSVWRDFWCFHSGVLFQCEFKHQNVFVVLGSKRESEGAAIFSLYIFLRLLPRDSQVFANSATAPHVAEGRACVSANCAPKVPSQQFNELVQYPLLLSNARIFFEALHPRRETPPTHRFRH